MIRKDHLSHGLNDIEKLKELGYTIESLNGDSHFRINGVLDVYPKSQRCCFLRQSKWSSFDSQGLFLFVSRSITQK